MRQELADFFKNSKGKSLEMLKGRVEEIRKRTIVDVETESEQGQTLPVEVYLKQGFSMKYLTAHGRMSTDEATGEQLCKLMIQKSGTEAVVRNERSSSVSANAKQLAGPKKAEPKPPKAPAAKLTTAQVMANMMQMMQNMAQQASGSQTPPMTPL